MKLTVLLTMGLMGVFAAAPARAAQAAPAYVNENPADPAPLKLVGVEGRVRGLGGKILKSNVDIERAKMIQSTLAQTACA